MPFDARSAKLLQAGSHITIDDCPGLRLEATNTTKPWVYRYKSPVDGRMRQVKIGVWPGTSFAAAVVAWEALRAVRAAGRDPAMEKKQQRATAADVVAADKVAKAASKYTVLAACEFYWQGHVARNRAPKGAKEIWRMFRTMLGDLSSVPAAEVTRTQAFNLLDSFADIPVQAGKLRAELGAAWDYNLDAGRLPESTPNWWRQIMRGRFKSKGKQIEGSNVGLSKRWLTEDELSTLIPWLPNLSDTVADVLTLYLWTDTRGSEIVAMHVKEITEEVDGLWWTIPKAKTKNKKRPGATDLRVPLVGRAEQIVRKRMESAQNGWLFPTTTGNGPIEQKIVQEAVHFHQPYSKTRPERIRPRLPVTHWSPHDLRRTSRTLLAAMGCPDAIAEAIMGHMQPGIKAVYNRHGYDKERREWLTLLSRRLEDIAGA
jgi:integrase